MKLPLEKVMWSWRILAVLALTALVHSQTEQSGDDSQERWSQVEEKLKELTQRLDSIIDPGMYRRMWLLGALLSYKRIPFVKRILR